MTTAQEGKDLCRESGVAAAVIRGLRRECVGKWGAGKRIIKAEVGPGEKEEYAGRHTEGEPEPPDFPPLR